MDHHDHLPWVLESIVKFSDVFSSSAGHRQGSPDLYPEIKKTGSLEQRACWVLMRLLTGHVYARKVPESLRIELGVQ